MNMQEVLVNVQKIPSTSFIEEVMLLYGYVKELPLNAIIVELGTGLGRSTAAMAYACKGTNRRIYTIDNYVQGVKFTKEVKTDWSSTSAQDNLKKLDLDKYVTFLNCSTVDPELYSKITTPVDFIFIDAGHSYADVKTDIAYWKPFISKDGIMCGHDWSFKYPEGREVIKAVSEDLLHKDYPFSVDYRVWKVRRYW